MPVIIRAAEDSDIGQISRLEQMFFLQDRNIEEVESQIDLKGAYYFVAETEEKIIGYLSAKAILDEADLWYIAVEPGYQHQGIGNQLLKKFMEVMKEDEINSITLEVRKSNQNAISLYKKHDFREISIRRSYYKNPVEDAVILQYVKSQEET